MNRIACLILLLLYTAAHGNAAEIPPVSAIERVDPFIGTQGDHGQLYPGATVPFGLVKLSPDTPGSGHSGYQYEQQTIIGFSHTRLGGVGCAGAGGTLKLFPATEMKINGEYEKSSEKASPGCYAVTFRNGISAALTVSEHVGFHRYHFGNQAGKKGFVHVNPNWSYAVHLDSELREQGNDMLTGYVRSKNVGNRGYYKLYYAVQFSKPFDRAANRKADNGLWCVFPDLGPDRVLEVRVGISPIDVAQAIAEVKSVGNLSFSAAQQKAQDQWLRLLSRYELSGGVPAGMEDAAKLFYTCIYRSHLLPHNVTSSADTYRLAGDEPTLRRTRDTAADYVHYSGWSTWDDFRKFALISLMEPDIARNITRSIAEWLINGKISDSAVGYWPCPSVRNEFMPAILLDAYAKGLGGFDLAAVYRAGIPVHGDPQVEQPYGYYVKMRLAEALGRSDDAKQLRELALGYRSYWRASQVDGEGTVRGFILPNADKEYPQQDVNQLDHGFYEGNLWHYRLFCNYDMKGLIALRGSRAALVDDLDYYFRQGYHMALNEPCLAYPFLFDYLGRPDLTQKWSRTYTTEVVTSKYHNHGPFKKPVVRPVYQATPDGFLPTMDDDTGAMSCQYVYQALGLYPAVMGDPYYVIGSPIFPEVTLHLKNGKRFVIRAKNVSSTNFYIQSATLDGKPYAKPWIRHDAITKGGVLELQMGPKPSTWGSASKDAPPSLTE